MPYLVLMPLPIGGPAIKSILLDLPSASQTGFRSTGVVTLLTTIDQQLMAMAPAL